MAEALIFHYRKQERFLNHCNPMTKFLSVIVLCLALIYISLWGILIIFSALLIAGISQRLPLRQYQRELRFFLVLLALITIMEYVSSNDWLRTASAFFRFSTIILSGILIADSTAPDDLARSLGSLLDKVPFINGWRIASSIELTLSLLPMIFDASLEANTARKARLEIRRNPYRTIIGLSTSIFLLLLDKAEDLSLALEARNYDPDMPRTRLRYGRTDILLCILVILITPASFVV
ncbi:MAG: energy-coupling factor transporter transmembrane component T [Sphaerochaeta sp.]|nr:energy-coupling factor transporter transmembrane component T [Sphaerochaeta sp.]